MSYHFNRKYNDEDVLVVGCGNNAPYCQEDHSTHFTIDIEEDVNPSLVMNIETKKIPLPSNSFSTIIFEGIAVSIKKNIPLYKELIRISKKNAEFMIDFFMPGAYRHKQGYWTNIHNDILPFIDFNMIENIETFTKWIDQYEDCTLDQGGYLIQK